jgi:hypothetical protein
MASTDRPEVSREGALKVGEKLKALRESLPPDERVALDRILDYTAAKLTAEPSVQDLLADLPGRPELLDDVAGFMLEGRIDSVDLVTKTTTAVSANPLCPPPPTMPY